MEDESADMMVLGAIRSGARNFGSIKKMTKLAPAELEAALARLEERQMIGVQKKKGWLGEKIEIHTTRRGDDEVDGRINQMQKDWGEMVQVYKSGDKEKMREKMDDYKMMLPMMIFFGIADLMLFSAMFTMMGASMGEYVPSEHVPEGADAGGADGADGDFGFDIGF